VKEKYTQQNLSSFGRSTLGGTEVNKRIYVAVGAFILVGALANEVSATRRESRILSKRVQGRYEDEHNQVSNLRCSNRYHDYDRRDKSAGYLQYRMQLWK
jgi:hypothetical protein